MGFFWLEFATTLLAAWLSGPIWLPVKNSFIISWGMFACVAIIPLAFICGQVRDIPLPWTLIDCSFGVFGIVPLWLVRRWTSGLAAGTML
ncbi:MAG: hypothetical protein JNM00_02850 [Flavobacteriales bacterium]|nr:hypothetical protein [Flavobacteriales bacterium]